MPRKVLVVFGTRPEIIKLAPVCQALAARPDQFELVTCDTGQHAEMTRPLFSLFDLQPTFRLEVMVPGQTLFHVTSAVLQAGERLLKESRPDLLLVQGDTTTAMAATLGAYYAQCPVGHVEAGLRTHAKYSPFPEEVNRRIISQIADFHFAPTEAARANLLQEGIPSQTVWNTGNTIVDALQMVLPKVRQLDPSLPAPLPPNQPYILVTCHRRESFGEELRNICRALREVARRHPELALVYPVHLNPNVEKPVHHELSGIANIHLIPPQPYDQFLKLMDRARFLMTDSGGIQEEAHAFGKPLLVLRKHTERREALDAGYAWLVGSDSDRIVAEAERLIRELNEGHDFFAKPNPFGDGQASQRIASILHEHDSSRRE